MKKDVAQCTETYRFVPELAADMCNGLEGTGVFTKGEVACPKDGLVATCEFVGETQTEITYHYREKDLPLAQTVDGARAGCTMVNGKLTVAPQPEGVVSCSKVFGVTAETTERAIDQEFGKVRDASSKGRALLEGGRPG